MSASEPVIFVTPDRSSAKDVLLFRSSSCAAVAWPTTSSVSLSLPPASSSAPNSAVAVPAATVAVAVPSPFASLAAALACAAVTVPVRTIDVSVRKSPSPDAPSRLVAVPRSVLSSSQLPVSVETAETLTSPLTRPFRTFRSPIATDVSVTVSAVIVSLLPTDSASRSAAVPDTSAIVVEPLFCALRIVAACAAVATPVASMFVPPPSTRADSAATSAAVPEIE